MIVSSGLPQLIRPVLEREGDRRSRCARTTPRSAPDGWRVHLPRRGPVPGLRRPLQAPLAPRRPPARLRRRRLVGPLRVARLRPRVRARPASRAYLDEQGVPYEPFETLLRCRCCAFLSRTTSSSRPAASARSAADLANRLVDGALYRAVGGREVRIAAAPGGVDVEPLDEETRPVVAAAARRAVRPRRRSTPGRAKTRVLAPLVERLRGFRPPLQPDPFEALITSITAQQISLFAAVAIRNRLVERFGEQVGRRLGVPDARADRRGAGGASSSRSGSRAQGGVRGRARAQRPRPRRARCARTTTRCASGSRRCAASGRGRPSGSSPATSPGRARGRPATSRSARRPRSLYGVDVHELGATPRSVPEPVGALPAHRLADAAVTIRAATEADEAVLRELWEEFEHEVP